jgi:hypothetical protein
MSTLNRNRMIAGLSYALAFIVYVPINFGSSTLFPPLVAAFWGALLGHSLIMDYEKKGYLLAGPLFWDWQYLCLLL